jgi:hypothetical protein
MASVLKMQAFYINYDHGKRTKVSPDAELIGVIIGIKP